MSGLSPDVVAPAHSLIERLLDSTIIIVLGVAWVISEHLPETESDGEGRVSTVNHLTLLQAPVHHVLKFTIAQ